MVVSFDARALPSSTAFASALCPTRFTLQAHDGAVSALDINPHIRGCMVTGGTDKQVKVWNIDADGDSVKNVSLVTSRDLGVVRAPALPRAAYTHACCIGQGLHGRILARRRAHRRRRGLEGESAGLGRRRERGRAQGVRAEARAGRPRPQGEGGRRRHRCAERRRGQRGR
jgi:hypothetical protein